MEILTKTDSPKIVLLIGTEWFSKKGGLSTFNRHLCLAFARAGHKTFCYMPDFTKEEEDNARTGNVTLLKPPPKVITDGTDVLFQKPQNAPSTNFDIIIGHDHITGDAMRILKETFYPDAQTIFFIHTAPGEIEWHKPEQQIKSVAQKAEEKERRQKDIAKTATVVAAVGPHLYIETQSLLAGLEKPFKLIQFDPGLYNKFEEINFDPKSYTPEALLMGRLEDFTLKGVDVAVKAMHIVYNGWTKLFNNIPVKPKLIVRGAPVGSDQELLAKLKEFEASKLRIQIKNFNADIEVINEDIRKAAIVLVPSRAEGFGLVGLEAISNGSPVLLSAACGIAKLLYQIIPEEASNWIVPESVGDSIELWAQKIKEILEDRQAAANRLKKLTKIYSENISWENSTNLLIESLNVKADIENTLPSQKVKVKRSDRNMIEPGIFIHPGGKYEIATRKFDFFSHRMAQAFPGLRDLKWMTNPAEINERLQILLAEPLAFSIYPGRDEMMGGISKPFWWYRGGASMPIEKFEKLSDTKCLAGWYEWDIDKIAIYKGGDPYREFVYLRTRGESPASTSDASEINFARLLDNYNYVNQEYAIYKGYAITREEYDDGAAVINGKPESFTEVPSLRVRYLTAYNVIITCQTSVYNSNEADRIFGKYLDEFLKTDESSFPQLLEELEELDNERSYKLDYNLD